MFSFPRLIVLLLVTVYAMSLTAPKQMVFGFGKRSISMIPMKRRFTQGSFTMGLGKRGGSRKSFHMGFGKRSADPQIFI
ncbi:hypothetical protein CRE_06174 [Caenorhabditis remanei]|uniref:Uncharacterized protein n=2 Tax=Caenorhabditis remanei TaxID=31234 RepID=E3NJF5_CAERE|nr:hypothetical protein CRE_06174 [Caenorhabditis remanei]